MISVEASRRSRPAQSIVERGHAVIPSLLSGDEVSFARAAITALVARLAPPRLYAPRTLPLDAPGFSGPFAITSTGLAIPRVLEAIPALRELVLRPVLLDCAREVLGRDMRLELLGAAISDRSRPFFTWHTHIDGQDEGSRVTRRTWPDKPSAERIFSLVYLNDLDDDTGPLLVMPRRAGDPTGPPHELDAQEWPGQLVLGPRAGDAVLLEQCTWHAAHSMRRDGLRIFVGVWLAAAWCAPAPFCDPSLAGALRD